MKLVTAIIRPGALDDVREALNALDIRGMTISEVAGFGRQSGHSEVYRGAEYVVDFVPKLRVELLAADEDAGDIVRVVLSAAKSGRIGDGKVWVTPVEHIVRVRTGETGDAAL